MTTTIIPTAPIAPVVTDKALTPAKSALSKDFTQGLGIVAGEGNNAALAGKIGVKFIDPKNPNGQAEQTFDANGNLIRKNENGVLSTNGSGRQDGDSGAGRSFKAKRAQLRAEEEKRNMNAALHDLEKSKWHLVAEFRNGNISAQDFYGQLPGLNEAGNKLRLALGMGKSSQVDSMHEG